MAPTADDCAHALIEIVPEVMQEIRRHVRSRRGPDLSVMQVRILAFLAGNPGAPLSAVADYVGLTLPSTSTQVSNLVDRGLVHRAPSLTDRRYVALQLTNKGEALLTSVRQAAQASLAETVEMLSTQERQLVIDALQALRLVLIRAKSESYFDDTGPPPSANPTS